jgi:hypothetical protein
MTATYWLRVAGALWAERDTLRWPDGITVLGSHGPDLSHDRFVADVVLVKVRDEGASLVEFQGTEVEWTLGRNGAAVELLGRRVVGVRGV